jgi:Domain of unknown function (DUF4279)
VAVTDNSASLLIYSETQLAAAVSDVLGVQPTSIHEKGDRIPPQQLVINAAGSATRFRESVWCYTVRVEAVQWDRDPTGTASLRALLDVFGSKVRELESLRAHYETHISWSGHSTSELGGFVIEPELLRALGELGCRFFGDIYRMPADRV